MYGAEGLMRTLNPFRTWQLFFPDPNGVEVEIVERPPDREPVAGLGVVGGAGDRDRTGRDDGAARGRRDAERVGKCGFDESVAVTRLLDAAHPRVCGTHPGVEIERALDLGVEPDCGERIAPEVEHRWNHRGGGGRIDETVRVVGFGELCVVAGLGERVGHDVGVE